MSYRIIAIILSVCIFKSNAFSQVYGYSIQGDSVFFEFNMQECTKISGDDGSLLNIGEIDITSVSIAGDWNAWEKASKSYTLQQKNLTKYTLSQKTSEIGEGIKAFKFVINGIYWVEPPTKAINVSSVNAGDKTYQNWLISIPKKEVQIQSNEMYHIRLNIKDLPDGTLVMLNSRNDKISTDMVMNGKITWEGTSTNPAIAYLLFPNSGERIMFVLENKTYEITGRYDGDKITKKEINGSPLTKEYMDYAKTIDKYQTKMNKVSIKSNKYMSEGDTSKAEPYIRAWQRLDRESNRYNHKYVYGHPSSYFSLMLFSFCWSTCSIDSAKQMYEGFDIGLKETALGKDMKLQIENASKVSVGDEMKLFSIPDTSGKLFSMASLKGKWILLDFWGSWCGPCMANFPMVREIQREHKEIFIVGISTDSNKAAWLNAIRKEKTEWLQLCDLKGFQTVPVSQYNIKQFPSYILINVAGKIAFITSDVRDLQTYLKTQDLRK